MSRRTIPKLWGMLQPDGKRAAILLFAFMLVGMLLETISIGLVIPALALMTQEDFLNKYPLLVSWFNLSGDFDHKRIVMLGMLALVFVYGIRALFLAFLAWRQACFVFGLQARLSQRLFSGYLRQPYVFHLQRNSAQLIRNTISNVSGFANVIQQGLIFMTEALVLVGILTMLLVMEPLGALSVMIVLGVCGWLFNRVTRMRALKWGVALQEHEGFRIQHLQQGLGSVKDVKLLGREQEFLNQYDWHNTSSAKLNQRQAVLIALPRLWLELLAVVGLAVLVFAMIWQGKSLATLMPTLGLFAAAAFRLMPSANRILNAIHSIRFSLPIIDTLHDELKLFEASEIKHIDASPLLFNSRLCLENVNFKYPSSESYALQNINLTISKGQSVGIIGGSGAGKSTLIDLMLGLLTPSSGEIKVDETDIGTNLRGWQDQLGYVPQSIYLTDDTLRRNVAFGIPENEIDNAAVCRALCDAQLEDFIKTLPHGMETVVGERGVRLSGGQRQRIGIARALYHNPPVLVLDEATSSLDMSTESSVMESIQALHGKKTLIIVAHRLSTVAHCDYLYRLEHGRIADSGETIKMLENANNG